MDSIEKLIPFFEQQISSYSLPEEPKGLYEPISYTLEIGGKRIRPLMVYIGFLAFKDEYQLATPAALAIEIFHNFTLLHDDIMDNAMVRRGKPSVYSKWGENHAILSGDVMMIKAYEALASTPAANFRAVLTSFNKLATLVCEGQQYDMDFELRESVAIEEYIKMITLKTSALIAGALEIGAMCADAPEQSCNLLYEIGIELGIAFQIQDDLLDCFGDEKTFGKRIGGDILEGKKSYLWLTLLNEGSKEDVALARATVANQSISEEQRIETIKSLYVKYGVAERANSAIQDYFKSTIDHIDELAVVAERKKMLYELASKLIKRQN